MPTIKIAELNAGRGGWVAIRRNGETFSVATTETIRSYQNRKVAVKAFEKEISKILKSMEVQGDGLGY
jgi:hypothetical protein